MEQAVEKLLYSRKGAAEALSLSVRSVDYLITSGRLACKRVGGKILIPAGAVRRFAREDHPEHVRSAETQAVRIPKKPPVPVRTTRETQMHLGLGSAAESNL
jgi:hypothetical protein